MKAHAMVAAGLLFVSLPATGQGAKQIAANEGSYFGSNSSYKTAYLDQAGKNYSMALKSTNDGIVESAIAYMTFMRITVPTLDLKENRAQIVRLSESGKTPVIRYKAYLATVVFDSPASFQDIVKEEYKNGDEFFDVIGKQVHRTLLGQNIK